MLLKLNVMRVRATVTAANQEQAQLSIYPETKKCAVKLNVDSGMVYDDLDFSTLQRGQKVDVLIHRYGEQDYNSCGLKKDVFGDPIYHYEAVGIEKPAIHPFDKEKMYPEGLRCITAIVNKAAQGSEPVTALKVVDGQEMTIVIDEETLFYQAQSDEQEIKKLFNSLQNGHSVNVWLKKGSNRAEYLSVNYGLLQPFTHS